MTRTLGIIKNAWRYFLYITDSVFALFMETPEKSFNGDSRKKILLIRADGIGDSILWLDSLKGLLEVYPPESHECIFVCNISSLPVFQSMKCFSRIIAIDKPGKDESVQTHNTRKDMHLATQEKLHQRERRSEKRWHSLGEGEEHAPPD
jgi:hypothetical protein